ncbi:YccT family protein [Erwinia tasmaniensis]|uniref:Uncharacterized protein n=1 Tax=Erwinia tasmaniensis (strain DSM 17950 / CFBP 7177 / CIP 109463 / NCPPB 4357 / Et1/99) TaxID=465817 RepID=B2VDG9_ERWT9|nr:DUF2057 family protein [Erwinia tasmaniensis]CAO97142.1 Conserved hypothetical protein [Erwinia tasmaniensis Et1/99]
MKLRMAITGLLAMLVAANSLATTLKLSADIDLLVLDGRKITGSLLKGAEGLELERGEHQLLFQVEKTFKNSAQAAISWKSSPQIVTFTARSSSVVISIPQLTTLREAKHFDSKPRFTLVNELGAEVDTKRDRLLGRTQSSFEQAMLAYNMSGKVASVPRFAHTLPLKAPAGPLSGITSSLHPAQPVRLWLLQVDTATRQRLIMLMNALHTS